MDKLLNIRSFIILPRLQWKYRAYFSGEEMYDDFRAVFFWRIPQVRQREITLS